MGLMKAPNPQTGDWEAVDALALNNDKGERVTVARIINTESQLLVTANKTEGDISLLEFEHLKISIPEGYDWTSAILEGVNQATTQKKRLLMPPFPIKSRLVALENVNGLTIEFLADSKLVAVNTHEDWFMSIKKCKNVFINNYNCDGRNTYYRGLMILDGNENIHINSPVIKNISPKLVEVNPRTINSVGLFIANHNNKRIFVNNIQINGVKNNDNGVIGDSIGSSRGILFDSVGQTETIPCEMVRITGVDIRNIISEDGDGIQCTGAGLKHDIEIKDIFTDNTRRRSLKFQAIKGVTIDNIKVRHTDRTYNMTTGISFMNNGNTIRNADIDIKAIKGIEFHNNKDDGHKTQVENIKVVLSSDSQIEGSNTYPIDLLDLSENSIAVDFTFKNLDLLGANYGMAIRCATKSLNIDGLKQRSYLGNKRAIEFFPPSTLPSGISETHVGLLLTNVDSETISTYAPGTVTFSNSLLGNAVSRDGADPYLQMYNQKGLQVRPRSFISTSIPTSGNYQKGDYVRNPSPTKTWDTIKNSWIITLGWIRLTAGSEHTSADWQEEKLQVTNTNFFSFDKPVRLVASAPVAAINNLLFIDPADNLLKFKDNSGTIKIVTLT